MNLCQGLSQPLKADVKVILIDLIKLALRSSKLERSQTYLENEGMLNIHACNVNHFWSSFGGYSGQGEILNFLSQVSGIKYFKGTWKVFTRIVSAYNRQLEFFKDKLGKFRLNPLYPLLELSEIKVVKNEDLRPVK